MCSHFKWTFFHWMWSIFLLALAADTSANEELEERFQQYIQNFQKNYDRDSREYGKRLSNFKASIARIQQLNEYTASARNNASTTGHDPASDTFLRTAVYGLTQFSDMSPEEFRADRQCVHEANNSFSSDASLSSASFLSVHASLTAPPAKWDWRDQSVVTGIKNQQACGSCWAFAAIETIETTWAIKTGDLYSLSVQQLISCDYADGNSGCKGGRYETVYSWLMDGSKLVDLDSEYPYVDGKGATLPCRTIATSSPVRIKSYQSLSNVSTATEAELLTRAVYYNGPVSITVDANTWQDYESGIIQHHCTGNDPDHAVVIVGYDTTGPIPYWIVRNTWGGGWGVGGYLYIEIGKNLCGLDGSPTYVVV